MKKYSIILFILLSICAFVQEATAQACTTPRCQDSLALVNLYNRTRGATWMGLANVPWNLSQPMTQWGGVTLTAGRVTSLNLSGLRLNGTLSDSIGNLTELTVLNLSNNSLRGAVPNGITRLTKLVTLNISKNQFTSLPDLSGLTSLGSLIVNNNQLGFGSLEPNIGKFSTFTYLPDGMERDTLGTSVRIGNSTTKDSVITIDEGDAFSYTIVVSGSNNLYQWFRNGTALSSPSPESRLELPDATKNTQEGRYLLQITNTRVPGLTFYRKLTIIINPCRIVGSRIDRDQSICEGEPFPVLQGTVPTGQKGRTLTYQWQRSIDQRNWTNIGIGQNLTIGSLPDTVTYFRRIARDGRCIPDTSNIVIIKYFRKLANNVIGSDQVICLGDTARELRSLRQVTGGDGQYNYQWQYSTNRREWTDADGSENFKPFDVFVTTYFRRIVSDQTCFVDTSKIVTVKVLQPFGDNIIGRDQTICPNGRINFLGDTVGITQKDTINFKFQWQASLDRRAWVRADTINKADTMLRFYPERIITRPTYFRRIVYNQCQRDTSNTVLIDIFRPIANNRIQVNTPVYCDGDTTKVELTGNVPIGGGGQYRYTWQSSLDRRNWNNRGDSLRLTLESITDTTYFRRIVRSLCYADTSNVVVVARAFDFGENRITSPSQLNCNNLAPDSLTATRPQGKGFFEYIWQTSPDSINWARVDTLGNGIGYRPPAQMPLGKIYIRRVIDNGCKLSVSNVISITTVEAIDNNLIRGNQSVCEGQEIREITGTIPLGGGGGYRYRWQVSTDSINWALADTSQNFKPQGIVRTSYYRRIVTARQCGIDTSNVVTVRFVSKVRNNIIRDNQEICLGARADSLSGSLPTGGDSTYTYIWQQSLTDSTWKTVANTRNYTPDLLRSTKFRRIVQSACFSDTSNVVLIAVNERPTNNRILGTGLIVCRGVQPDTLKGTTPVDNVGVFQYQWQVSKDRRTWVNIPRAVGKDLAPPIPDSTSYYRRIASNKCFSDTSLSVPIRLLELPKVDAGKDTSVTIGFGVRLLATGASAYIWTPKEGLDRDSTASPIASPRVTTRYIVTGIDAAGCRNVDTVLVRVINEADIDVVDVITPNGDGLNDVLYVKNIELYPENTIIIFNRWGKEIYQKKNYQNDWDGTINGELLPTGVYFYVINFGLTSRPKKGSFSIIN
ncbi:gliding motility-associated C-terminal domain-containing protein [Thermoflexibacter ruber]|uniref:Gliding motility-associated C-terminal domain-containing protein n=1 Tax=Thermoflexibacter ruber TaxID=1003 RepID=A0A1I2C5D4_9BACT|nr:gliding motility-associated C-terminal domain-containing protein [Thermoflexibacter ruber]SFE63616.1 gliding motility-associated C-terminal domain-containing protein [Thermoflexibacter ruber]